jgi:hypothetical protein
LSSDVGCDSPRQFVPAGSVIVWLLGVPPFKISWISAPFVKGSPVKSSGLSVSSALTASFRYCG